MIDLLNFRWYAEGTKDLPTCMQICFQALYDTINETAYEIQKEKGWDLVLPHLQQVVILFILSLYISLPIYVFFTIIIRIFVNLTFIVCTRLLYIIIFFLNLCIRIESMLACANKAQKSSN